MRRLDSARRMLGITVDVIARDGFGTALSLARRRVSTRWQRWRIGPPAEIDRTPTSFPEAVEPDVTVVVTAHNRADLIATALKSVQLQRLRRLECIVVDDGSSDRTAEVADGFQVDRRFRVIRHDESRGLAAARNTGLEAARAPAVCFLDDDDFLLADSLETRLGVLADSPPDVVGVFCDWINTDPDVGLEIFDEARTPTRRGTVTFATLRRGNPFIATAPLLRTSILRSVGGFDESFDRAEDAELWTRLLRSGFRFVDAEHVGVAYRRSPNSMVLADPAAQLETLMEIARHTDSLDNGSDWGPDPTKESLAELALAAERAPTIYRYLALIAVDDMELAVERGIELVPRSVRHEIQRGRLARELTSHVRARLSIKEPAELDRITRISTELANSLVPPAGSCPPEDPNE